MIKHKLGLLIGRFQPFHKGHLYLIKRSFDDVENLIIGIGSAKTKDKANPFSFTIRKKMIEIVGINESISQKIVKIVPLVDFFNDEKWFNNCLKLAGKIDVVIGNNEWTNKIFEVRNYPVLRYGFYKKYLYEGVKIRKLMQENKPWKKRVPEYLVQIISDNLK